MKNEIDDIPMVYLLYVVLGIFVMAAGAAAFVIRMF